MGALKAMENVYWVGVLDKELEVFDIIMTAEKGTTYNSFIVKGGNKTVLFETAKDKFYDDFISNIREVCDPKEIDYIVVNHTEPDHTGSLARLLKEEATNASVLGSQTAITFLKEIVNAPFPHQAVTEKDTFDIGGMTLNFMSVPMLHWPDSMFTYIPEIEALFTCDTFGCHYADDRVFNDLMTDIDFVSAYEYYFIHIMGPFKKPFMQRALDRIKELSIKFVGNGHGPVLRTDIPKYIEMYENWCKTDENKEKEVAIAYVSAYGYTKSLAMQIEQGLKEGGIQKIKMFDLVTDSMQEAKLAVAAAEGMLLGSPTLVGDALPPIYEVIVGLNPIIHKSKFAGVFGSFGWSGEAVPNLSARIEQLHMTMPLPGMKVRLKPTEEDLENARQFGKEFALAMLKS